MSAFEIELDKKFKAKTKKSVLSPFPSKATIEKKL